MRTVLVLAANPKDSSRLRLDEEVRDIEDGLRRSRCRDEFVFVSEWAVGVRELRRALLDHRPEFVHFSGHATEGGIGLENEFGMTHHVGADALSELFSNFVDHVRCVLLNACHSQPHAKAISRVIPYAIGMREKIEDKAAIEFAVGFYDGVGAGREIPDAFALGCSAIHTSGLPGHHNPVLYRRRGRANLSRKEPSPTLPSQPSPIPSLEPSRPNPTAPFRIPDLHGPPASGDRGGPGRRDLLTALKDVPNAKVLDAATSAVLALLVSHLFVPDQLRYLPTTSFGLAALAMLASWVWSEPLKERIGTVIVATTLLLATLIFLNQRFVRDVPANDPDPTHYLIGTDLSPRGRKVAAGLGNPPDAEIINLAGYDLIPELWNNYEALSQGYTAVFCCFVFVGTLAVSGSLGHVGRHDGT